MHAQVYKMAKVMFGMVVLLPVIMFAPRGVASLPDGADAFRAREVTPLPRKEVALPPASIEFAGVISRGDDGIWHGALSGTQDGVTIDYSGSADWSNPAAPTWDPPLPSVGGDPYAAITQVYANPAVFQAMQGLGLPDGCWTDRLEINTGLHVGQEVDSQMPAGDGGYEIKKTTSYALDFSFLNAQGRAFRMEDLAHVLVEDYGLATADVSQIVNCKFSANEVRACFVAGAKRKLVALGASADVAEQVHELALANRADQARFMHLAEQALLQGGVAPQALRSLTADLTVPGNALGTLCSEGDDITVTVEAHVDVEVSVPPFAKVTVGAKVTLSGPLSKYAELAAKVNQMASDLAQQLAAQIRAQLEALKAMLDQIAKDFKAWLDQYRGNFPWWVQMVL
jgi:outer membrane murein-binding lipoprotein Lpp